MRSWLRRLRADPMFPPEYAPGWLPDLSQAYLWRHRVSQRQYDRMLLAGEIRADTLYLVGDHRA